MFVVRVIVNIVGLVAVITCRLEVVATIANVHVVADIDIAGIDMDVVGSVTATLTHAIIPASPGVVANIQPPGRCADSNSFPSTEDSSNRCHIPGRHSRERTTCSPACSQRKRLLAWNAKP